MKKFPHIIFSLLAFCFLLNTLHAQDAPGSAVIKVACIGNSITFGSGLEDKAKDSYPSVLGRILGAEYEVRNFGVSGRTLLKKGDNPYWKEAAFLNAIEFNPDIVIIKLGTNDSKPQNWKFKDEFEKDYGDLIDTFKKLRSIPKIFICKPVPASKNKFGIRDSVITNDIIPIIEKVGTEKEVVIIDLYAPFINEGRLFPDGVHPNIEGAAMMAKEIYKAISEKK